MGKYDDFEDFVWTQANKVNKDFEKTFDEVNKSAIKYHSDRCDAEGKRKDECLKAFMDTFAKCIAESLMKERLETEVKSFGFLITPSRKKHIH